MPRSLPAKLHEAAPSGPGASEIPRDGAFGSPEDPSAPAAGPVPVAGKPAESTAETDGDVPARQPPIDRVVSFRPRSILMVLGVLMAVAAAIGFAILTSSGLTLIGIAAFLALALNPAVEFFQRHGFRRGWAVVAVFILALGVIALLVLVFIPPMVTQVSNLINAVPGFLTKLSQGNGPFGILERRFQVVERVQGATSGQSFASWTSAALSGLEVVRRVATSFVGTVLIAFLSLFMLLEGPDWRRRITILIPDSSRGSIERVGAGVYRAVGGFVAGNLLASLVSGIVATLLLFIVGVPYALPLGLFVVIVDLVPYVGPALATVLLTAVALTQGPVRALVVFCVLLAYHVVEGHSLRPLIYGRALRLSPLAVLIAIVLGTELAGILGTLAAIPVAGAVQVGFTELLRQRAARRAAGDRSRSTTPTG
jgi:predicted PurR-regulated permease PerM